MQTDGHRWGLGVKSEDLKREKKEGLAGGDLVWGGGWENTEFVANRQLLVRAVFNVPSCIFEQRYGSGGVGEIGEQALDVANRLRCE
jgi:hypothetical protein